MTSVHPGRAAIEGFVGGSLPPAELAAVDRHLAGCANCRDVAASLARTVPGLLVAVGGEWGRHLTFEELEALAVKGDAPVDAMARGHLARCASCRTELNDLNAFEDLLPLPATSESELRAEEPLPGPVSPARAWARRLLWSAAGIAAALVAIVVIQPQSREATQSRVAPLQLVVQLGAGAATAAPTEDPRAARPDAGGLSPDTLLAINQARRQAATSGRAVMLQLRVIPLEYAALRRELQSMGTIAAGDAPAAEPDVTRSGPVDVSLTLLPPPSR